MAEVAEMTMVVAEEETEVAEEETEVVVVETIRRPPSLHLVPLEIQ